MLLVIYNIYVYQKYRKHIKYIHFDKYITLKLCFYMHLSLSQNVRVARQSADKVQDHNLQL